MHFFLAKTWASAFIVTKNLIAMEGRGRGTSAVILRDTGTYLSLELGGAWFPGTTLNFVGIDWSWRIHELTLKLNIETNRYWSKQLNFLAAHTVCVTAEGREKHRWICHIHLRFSRPYSIYVNDETEYMFSLVSGQRAWRDVTNIRNLNDGFNLLENFEVWKP